MWRPLPSTWEGQQYSRDVILENLWLSVLGIVRWSPGFTNLDYVRVVKQSITVESNTYASDPLTPDKALDKPGIIWIYRWSFKWPSDELKYNDMNNRDLLKISYITQNYWPKIAAFAPLNSTTLKAQVIYNAVKADSSRWWENLWVMARSYLSN